jgi:hypothetical protein
MKVSIEQDSQMTNTAFFGQTLKTTGNRSVKLNVQFTEEEKEIIKRGNLANEVFFIKHNADSSTNPEVRVSTLLESPDYQFLPESQDATAMMRLEQDLEKCLRTLKTKIDELANYKSK